MTGNVLELAYVIGVVWQKNSLDLWWSKTSPSAPWEPPYGTLDVPVPVYASWNNTTVFVDLGAGITDASANVWTITAGGQVAVNGIADPLTGNVLALAYVNGVVWQRNSHDLWWSKTSPGAAWEPPHGTSVDPVPVTASLNDTVVAFATGSSS